MVWPKNTDGSLCPRDLSVNLINNLFVIDASFFYLLDS